MAQPSDAMASRRIVAMATAERWSSRRTPRWQCGGGSNWRATAKRADGGGVMDAGGNGGNGQQGWGCRSGAAATISESMAGKLSFIDNAVDTATGTVQLKATFDNSTGRLWAGQFATTSLHLYDQENALVVPQQAIVTGQRGSYVYVVDQADTARQRAVVVERTADGLAVIASGIHDGDRVVTEGQSRLTPDAPVRLRGQRQATRTAAAASGNGGGRRAVAAAANAAAKRRR